ncbi:MAG: Ig-like domain-containing protein [Blautia sp.]|nr:Ig-like domain-containing protein [Blautia sp.]
MWKSKSIRVLFLLLLMFMITGASGRKTFAASLNCYEGALYEGKTFQLKVTGGTVKSWKSADPSIASINSNGLITARSKGSVKVGAYLTDGSKLICVVNVRSKKYSKYLTNSQAMVMLNIIGAVESGGQVYGQRDYACFDGPGQNSYNEKSCTAGAFQEYGECLRQLLIRIYNEYPRYFKKWDTAGIAKDCTRVWTQSNPYAVASGSKKAKAIQNIISKGSGARYIQNLRAIELTDQYIAHILSLGVTNARIVLFLADCEHQGGSAPVERIVKRAKNKNSMASIVASLKLDQKDTSNNDQIGDLKYWRRRELVYNWIKKTIPASAKIG